jgi:predicted Zn-dependent protease
VLDAHPHEPLAQYLALHSSPVLRKHASRWAAASNTFGEGFLRRLALGHALCQRWSSGKSLGSSVTQRAAERKRALEYVKKHQGTALAWALLGLVQDRTTEEKDQSSVKAAYQNLADVYGQFSETPGLSEHARYEQARCLFRAGQKAEARKRFLTLYEEAAKQGAVLVVDSDFRSALLGESDGWSALMRRAAEKLVKDNKRLAVLVLARQVWQLDDAPLSDHLFRMALDGVPTKGNKGLALHRAALTFLVESSQTARADRLVRQLLRDEDHGKRPDLWRLASQLAAMREMPARRLECLEKALELEFEHLPEAINLEQVRSDYGALLDQYEKLTAALATLKLPMPAGFTDKVIRAADRWRALDRDQEHAANAAAKVLRSLGERDLAWDYLTTPVALRPGESEVWSNLASSLQRQGQRDLADRAWQAAFQRESSNPQFLWDRAGNLRQSGKLALAQKLYRQIADGDWQPRFDSLKTQAQWMLER